MSFDIYLSTCLYPYSEMLLQGDREENITQENDGEKYIKI